jgi:hypoxanthine phosphoribosyltransferase
MFPGLPAGRYTSGNMHRDIAKVLISQWQIAARIQELAREITADHTPPRMAGPAEITIVPIMTGAMIFASDLIRQIPIAMRIGLLTVSSYPGTAMESQGSRLDPKSLPDVKGRHVLLLDDILDSGGTLKLVVPNLERAGAASVKTCVLLRKDRPSVEQPKADYVGFDIPDEFVVGYGLDYDNYYRNLPDIAVLGAAAIERVRRGAMERTG